MSRSAKPQQSPRDEARTLGNTHPLYAPHGHFRCNGEQSWVAVSVQTERQWERLLKGTGEPALDRFTGLDAQRRVAERRDIESALEAWTARHSADDVVAALSAIGVPVAPVANYHAMAGALWRRQRALARVIDHPYIGRQEIVVPPWSFRGQSAGVARAAPLLGADTDAVLAALPQTAGAVASASPTASAAAHHPVSGEQ